VSCAGRVDRSPLPILDFRAFTSHLSATWLIKERKLADEGIDLAQTKRQLRVAFQVTSNEVIMARAGFQSHAAGLIGGSDPILFNKIQHAEDAAHRFLAQVLMHSLTQRTNVRSVDFGAAQ
jgi:hypothetical protein